MWSISATTRPPRPAEVHGRDYLFVSPEEFARLERDGEFLEDAEVHGNRYGTPRGPIEAALAEGKTVLVEVDIQGARQIRAAGVDALFVFIDAPSRQELHQRLTDRGTESPEDLQRRLRNADDEMAAAVEFDHRIVNEVLEKAVDELVRILEDTSRPSEETP